MVHSIWLVLHFEIDIWKWFLHIFLILILVYSRGNVSTLSPYLNVDPSYLSPVSSLYLFVVSNCCHVVAQYFLLRTIHSFWTQNGPEFIFPEGASRHRGRFEFAFSQIGGSVMTGIYRNKVILKRKGVYVEYHILNYLACVPKFKEYIYKLLLPSTQRWGVCKSDYKL